MATYSKSQLLGDGILGEVLTGAKNFRFINSSTSNIYFTLEAVKNGDYEYIPSGSFGIADAQKVTGIIAKTSAPTFETLDSLVESDYKWSISVPPGTRNLRFTPSATIPANSYRLRATGEMTKLQIS